MDILSLICLIINLCPPVERSPHMRVKRNLILDFENRAWAHFESKTNMGARRRSMSNMSSSFSERLCQPTATRAFPASVEVDGIKSGWWKSCALILNKREHESSSSYASRAVFSSKFAPGITLALIPLSLTTHCQRTFIKVIRE
jgi:hypothetical protein